MTSKNTSIDLQLKISSPAGEGSDVLNPKEAFIWQLLTAGLTLLILLMVRSKVKHPVMLLADRFVPWGGMVEAILLSLYAFYITGKLLTTSKIQRIRSRIWLFFSAFFFLQLLLGLAGFERFLMTGKLHLPIPGLVIAGPIYRWGGPLFMVFLFSATVLLAGPVWCSYLCYIGSWDNSMALVKKHARRFPAWGYKIRWIMLVLVIVIAFGLRFLGISSAIATWIAVVFGLTGVVIMLFISRKRGYLAHCTMFCPLGSVAVLFGKLNPMRVKIQPNVCDECMACVPSCRYGALNADLIRQRKVGFNCTLCGDCLSSCHVHAIQYRFLKLSPRASKILFVVLVVVLHTTFLGFARI